MVFKRIKSVEFEKKRRYNFCKHRGFAAEEAGFISYSDE